MQTVVSNAKNIMRLVLSSLIFIIISSCDFTSAEEYYNHSIEYAENGEIDKAILSLNKAIEKNNHFRAALRNRAWLKHEIDDYNGAIEDYKEILQFDKDNTLSLYNLGLNYQMLEDFNKAIGYYSEALKSKGALKTFSAADNNTLITELNFDLSDFDNDSEYNLKDCGIYYQRGIAYLLDKKYQKAISDFNKSKKSNCFTANNYYYIGEAYIGLKDSINACENFIAAAKLGDKDAREMLKKHCIKRK